ncbi:MAG: FkbM family methyltransferase [Verrucomicrobiaceae bacterium]|nr:FkbM family methyltransferase [Verrucomicrobiaceae bacterium]
MNQQTRNNDWQTSPFTFRLLHAVAKRWPFLRGRDWLMRKTFGRAFGDYLAKSCSWVDTRGGWTMRANNGIDYTSRSLKLFGEMEKTTSQFLLKHMPEHGCFLDVGANVGYFSLEIAHRRPHAQVIAIEPNPQIAALLSESIAHNQLTERIHLHSVAASDITGELKFRLDQENTGHSRLAMETIQDAIIVSSVILDDWLPSHLGELPLSVVKIDVEGAELRVLRGMARLIKQFHPTLVIEGYDDHLREFGDSLSALVKWLDDAGYKEVEPRDGNLYLIHREAN